MIITTLTCTVNVALSIFILLMWKLRYSGVKLLTHTYKANRRQTQDLHTRSLESGSFYIILF